MLLEYPAFVKERFVKRASDGEGLMHAAVGMTGELIELILASSRENQIEELGDIEFYFCAAHLVLGMPYEQKEIFVSPSDTGLLPVYFLGLKYAENFQDQA